MLEVRPLTTPAHERPLNESVPNGCLILKVCIPRRRRIADLICDGQPTPKSESILSEYEKLLAIHIADRDRLLKELGGSTKDGRRLESHYPQGQNAAREGVRNSSVLPRPCGLCNERNDQGAKCMGFAIFRIKSSPWLGMGIDQGLLSSTNNARRRQRRERARWLTDTTQGQSQDAGMTLLLRKSGPSKARINEADHSINTMT